MAILGIMYKLIGKHKLFSESIAEERTTTNIEPATDVSSFSTEEVKPLVPTSLSEQIRNDTTVETVGQCHLDSPPIQSDVHLAHHTDRMKLPDRHEDSQHSTSPKLFGKPVEIPMGAIQLGTHFANQGKNYVKEEVHGFFAYRWSQLRWYFDVDDKSVMRKLFLLCWPYCHKVWSSRRYNGRELPSRLDVNAPDLYIPVNGFATLVLASCFLMGQNDPQNFSPALLGDQVAYYLTWLALEFLVVFLTMKVLNIRTDLAFTQILCLLCYKFVGMSLGLVAAMALGSAAYRGVLGGTGFSLAWFMGKTLSARMPLPPPGTKGDGYRCRRCKMITGVSLLQPLIMWLLTFTMVSSRL